MTDDHHLRSCYRKAVTSTTRTVTHIIQTTTTRTHHIAAGGDPHALRGIPALGYGIPGGAIPGTRPDTLDWVEKPPRQHRRKL